MPKLTKLLGFQRLPHQDTKELKKTVRPLVNKFQDIVVIGMGGSILGAQMLYHTLKSQKTVKSNFHFIDTIDPDAITEYGKILDKKNSLFIFVSLSGDTLEVSAIFDIVIKGAPKWFGKTYPKHLLVITGEEQGFLFKQAKKHKIQTLKMPNDVGGRYSVLTVAGLTIAALMGTNINKILAGAAKSQEENTYKLLSEKIYKNYKKNKKTIAILPYINSFEYFNRWAVQLISESLGKNSKTGPLPISLIGPRDQHSVLQLLLDGPKDKWVLFIDVKKHNSDFKSLGKTLSEILAAQKKGTETALNRRKIPNATITLEKINEESIGYLIQTFEEAVYLSGKFFKINPFSQPAVELGKKITKELLKK